MPASEDQTKWLECINKSILSNNLQLIPEFIEKI